MLPRRLLRILADKNEGIRIGRTDVYHPVRAFLLQHHAFGLKNAGATYQRMIQTCLEKQIGKTLEAYVDDVVIKTKRLETLVDDLRLMFDNLRTYDIWLNPEKCVFGVPARKLLG